MSWIPTEKDLPPPFYDALEEYMAEFTDDDRKLLAETHNNLIKLNTVLLGANGDEGLVGDVHKIVCRQDKTESRLTKLYIIVASIGGLGTVGAGITKLLELW